MSDLIFEVVEGPDAGKRIEVPIGSDLEIGRVADDSGGRGPGLADDQVSRRHMRIRGQDGGLAILEDLGSRNGTLVNGREAHGQTVLHAGDVVQVGVSVLELRSAAQVRAQPSVVRPIPAALRVAESPPDYIGDQVLHPGRNRETPSLDALLDARVKHQARTAPLALFVLAALAVLIYLGAR